MKHLYLFALLLFYVTGTNPVQAHAVVTHSSLDIKSVIAEQETQVELTFNSKIELNLSQIFLVSAGDEKHPLIAHAEKKPGHIIIDLPPLKKGEYAIQLTIFAADGHLSEDLVRFVVTENIPK